MSAAWEYLHNEDLSAFIAQGLAANESEDFALHLEQYGTVDDFTTWIHSRNSSWVMQACQWLPYCPTLAQHSIIEALNTDAIANIHNEAMNAVIRARTLQCIDVAVAQNICAHITYQKTPLNWRAQTFTALLEVGAVDVIVNNADVFGPVINANPDQACIQAAHAGWDLATHMAVEPPLNSGYFISCCVGGLIERAKQCNISPTDHKTLCTAFTLSLYRTNSLTPSNDKSLKYLWESYPSTPWYKDTQILNFVNHAPLSLLPKILEHYDTHAPGVLRKMATSLACNCLERDDLPRFNLLYAFSNPTEHDNVFYSAIAYKRKDALLQLLDEPEGTTNFFQRFKYMQFRRERMGPRVLQPTSKQRVAVFASKDHPSHIRPTAQENLNGPKISPTSFWGKMEQNAALQT